ncbi:MAG: thioesterase family protein [Crocinitomicaceae bacterium]|nr:thioesterase family protein [Crocinitomicaceae bacterium]
MKILESSIEISVRFSETDAMGVVWHGNYLKFFEDAREHFGEEFGMEYLDMYNKGYFTPIVKSEINHKASIYYGQNAVVRAILEKHPASKIVFRFEVTNLSTGKIAAKGKTMQVFLDKETDLLELIKPKFYTDWEALQNWKEE